MTERPIPFSAPMVRANLREVDPKTQTRRVVKGFLPCRPEHDEERGVWEVYNGDTAVATLHCPYGQPGDRLWVREAWRAPLAYELTPPRDIPPGTPIVYQADGAGSLPHFNAGKLRPGMFMPRWASRILLEVTAVRVERLQDISEADAIAEGLTQTANGSWLPGPCDYPEWAYHQLWEQINGPGSWDANPWVWVVEFRRLP